MADATNTENKADSPASENKGAKPTGKLEIKAGKGILPGDCVNAFGDQGPAVYRALAAVCFGNLDPRQNRALAVPDNKDLIAKMKDAVKQATKN